VQSASERSAQEPVTALCTRWIAVCLLYPLHAVE